MPVRAALVLACFVFIPAGTGHAHSGDGDYSFFDYTLYRRATPYPEPKPAGDGHFWWKGNLHTHTLWSDGNQFPEVVTRWYVNHGYHFLALSEHNILARGEKWINPRTYYYLRNHRQEEIVRFYQHRFGDWADVRKVDAALRKHLLTLDPTGGAMTARRPQDDDIEIGETVVRLRTLEEFRGLFERPDRFLLIDAVEITASGRQSVHINAANIVELDRRSAGSTVEETVRINVDAVAEQSRKYGRPMMAQLNHPNWRWAVRAEDFIAVENLRFFELYNGGRRTGNHGDDLHASLERVWDIVLTKRLAVRNLGVVYGLAVDDAHQYGHTDSRDAMPGRGWVMVRSRQLNPEDLILAMKAGDFYSSTGVTLRSIRATGDALTVEIAPEEGVSYRTEFIGTLHGFDPRSEPVRDDNGEILEVTRRYSDDIGKVLKAVDGVTARYDFTGDEIYVRARIVSSKLQPNPFAESDKEMAWVQPVTPLRAGSGADSD